MCYISAVTYKDRIPPDAYKIITKKQGHLRKPVASRRKKKQRKELMVAEDGYNFLEWYGVIRKYFQWKYDLRLEELECLYYLYCKHYFTQKDYREFPQSWGFNQFKSLEEKKMIKNVFPEKKLKKVYRLTQKAQHIIVTMHLTLAGKLKIPTLGVKNPIFSRNASYSQKRYRNIILDMNAQLDELDQKENNS